MDPVGWSDLQRELLTLIGNRLNNRIDVLRFRSVCSSWRNSVPPFRKWQLRRFSLPDQGSFLSFAGTTVFCLQSIHNSLNSPPPKAWLIRVSDSDRQSKTRLLNPLSDRGIKPLRPLNLNLLEFRISEICRSYLVKCIDPADFDVFTNFDQPWVIEFGKVFFFSDTDLITGTTTANDSMVVVLENHRSLFGGGLGTFRLGENEFSMLAQSKSEDYRDIVIFNGQIYVVDVRGNCYTVDSSLNVTLIAPHLDGQVSRKKNLVVSSGELLMVDTFFLKTGAPVTEISCGYEMGTWFRVYKLDEEEQNWVEVTNLGDRMLFVGQDGCFSVCAADFDVPNCRGNCIFFVDENYHDPYDEVSVLGDMKIGVFNLEDRSVGPLVYFPGYADLFWPPPSWLAPTSSSSSQS